MTDDIQTPMFEENWKSILAGLGVGAATLMEPTYSKADTQTNQPAKVVVTAPQSSDSKIVNFIVSVENSKGYQPGGWNKKSMKWEPYIDKGASAIGYGHRVKAGEDFSGGITDKEAVELVKKDIKIAKQNVYKELASRYKFVDTLDSEKEAMLVDFMYNLGTLSKFPKFTRAVINNDWPTAIANYKRFSNGKELADRNEKYYNTFLKVHDKNTK